MLTCAHGFREYSSWFSGPATFGPVLRLYLVVECEVEGAAYLQAS